MIADNPEPVDVKTNSGGRFEYPIDLATNSLPKIKFSVDGKDIIIAASIETSSTNEAQYDGGDTSMPLAAFLRAMHNEGFFEGMANMGVGRGRQAGDMASSGYIGKQDGKVNNPSAFMLFKDMGRRNFQFTFDFYPTSREEAEMVISICKIFQYYLHPGLARPTVYTVPLKFDHIKFMDNKTAQELTKINNVFCTNAVITHSQSPILLEGGYEPHTNLSVQFSEDTIHTRESDEVKL